MAWYNTFELEFFTFGRPNSLHEKSPKFLRKVVLTVAYVASLDVDHRPSELATRG